MTREGGRDGILHPNTLVSSQEAEGSARWGRAWWALHCWATSSAGE